MALDFASPESLIRSVESVEPEEALDELSKKDIISLDGPTFCVALSIKADLERRSE
jgi:hypothetical protein